MSFQGDNLLIGLVCLALLPIIAWRILRGLREGRLPLYRSCLERGDNAAKFGVLLALHAVTFILIAVVAADLLLDLGLREGL
ncbi:MAG: hypothetical protein ACT4N8_12230 [Sphingosinicella sp.]|uniref:hypothetical protein n=1 Tax=Sphingosinicella sp. TaxID=1917971 RepID=UPI00403833DC